MSVLRIRYGRVGRVAVTAVLTVFIVFGGSFVPLIKPSSVHPMATATVLSGADATQFIKSWERRNSKRTEAMERTRRRGEFSGRATTDTQIVVITGGRRVAQSGLIAWINTAFGVSAQEYFYTDGGVLILSPYDAGNSNIAAFDYYYEDTGGSSTGGNARIDTVEAAYGSVTNAIEVDSVFTNCTAATPSRGVVASLWDLASPALQAQTSHDGVACNDASGMTNKMHQRLKDSIELGLVAAAGALVPCAFATVGYLACVGGAAIGAMAGYIGYEFAEELWDCRCTWFGFSCGGGEEEPPPI